MMVLVDVDPWGSGPNLDALPMPGQAPRTTAGAPSSDNSTQLIAPAEPQDPGATPVEFGLGALVSALAGLAGLRRGRLMSVLLRLRSLRMPVWSGASIPVPKWPAALSRGPRWPAAGFRRQTQRALAVVRLTLGILRLW